ncbi:vanadium-dependent haloperoxidase [Maribacter flavus]|uniref:Vanadium-dependent haloperoxidase n=1 Tax=Maribacter flavus TaxID=1658664 RepID=A0A5B2TY20_9FLAO|nr:vanadium-dependent haloperoxidase [Maribacter flavus]KAA2219053.1 vanadium-dependent haloperoxidase [Maribacter flavus]
MFRKRYYRHLIILLVGITFFAIIGCENQPKPAPLKPNEVAIAWAKLTLFITQHTPSNSPTFASRAFGYIGLTMYESVVHGYEDYHSLEGQLNELESLPKPDTEKQYDWVLSLNAAQASILRDIYIQTSEENVLKIDSLERRIYEQYSKNLKEDMVTNSISFGKEVAQAIFEWSKTDGGHRGYLHNFDKEIIHPDFPGSWKPPLFAQSFSHHPLHPHWGENRTFVSANAEVEDPEFLPYDTVPGSPYYKQFEAVYKKERELTRAEKESAIWWGDDPDVSFTPPGHSYYIATLAAESSGADLITVAKAYAQTGISVADAFIECWKWKYAFFTERPNTFVPKYIDEEWESFWPDPPFPAFPSGHAIQAAAAATALEDNYGTNFKFTDRAHEGRERDKVRDTDFTIRSFDSFWEAAQETADSRFYGGIHTPIDNEVGLAKGVEIATNVNNLKWKN